MVLQSQSEHLVEGEAMSATDREALLRDASKQKLRGMRLRDFGDEDEQWESTLLLRKAAKNELAALGLQANASEEEQARARIEACGLFLDAYDPVRAAEQWNQIPRRFSPPNDEASWLVKLSERYQDAIHDFGAKWRAIKPRPDVIPEIDRLSLRQVRTLLKHFSGIPELWWAVAERTNDPDALERATQLEPGFGQHDYAVAAWKRIEAPFVRELRIKLSPARRENILRLDVVGRLATAFSDLLSDFADGFLDRRVELIPVSATPGSFVWNVSAWGLPSYAIEELQQRATQIPAEVGAKGLLELLEQLDEHNIELTASTGEQTTQAPQLVFDTQRRKPMLEAARALAKIASLDIPQANSLDRVFRMVEMYVNDEEITSKALGVTPRQIRYYRDALGILGFLDDSKKLTPAGRQLVRLRHRESRLSATVVHFESSVCGERWIQWSNADTLLGVDATSARQFIQECAAGLNGETTKHRAQCLAAWHAELIQYHYAKS